MKKYQTHEILLRADFYTFLKTSKNSLFFLESSIAHAKEVEILFFLADVVNELDRT